MTVFDDVKPETIRSGTTDWIDADGASRLARHPLSCVDREYPHYLGSVDGPDDVPRPSEQHPLFYGCFDWHSAVHSHWSLARQLRLFDEHPNEAGIRTQFDAALTDEAVAGEVAHFEDHETFEKPYGWGWLLRLAAELHLWDDPTADAWRDTLRPLEARIVELVETELLTRDRPSRVGTHGNSAFALTCVLDYARVVSNDELESAAVDRSIRWFADDVAAPVAYGPLGWDFVSPSLTEADLLRRVFDPRAFEAWLDGFLPDVTAPPHDGILDPVAVRRDSEGGLELHLVGLNLAKAWCLAGVADALDDDHRYASHFEESAVSHAEAGIDRAFTDDYGGSHWLSSFALFLLSRNEGAIAPT